MPTHKSNNESCLTLSQENYLENFVHGLAEQEPHFEKMTALAKYGRIFQHVQHFPKDLSMGLVNQCLANGTRAIMPYMYNDNPPYFYAEGLALDPGCAEPFWYAWLVNADGDAIDLSRSYTENTVFFGVMFKGGYVLDALREAKSFGILRNPRLQGALYASSECFSAALADPNVNGTPERCNQETSITRTQRGRWKKTRGAEDQLFEKMVADLRDGRIKPRTPLYRLTKFYNIVDVSRLRASMWAACRQYETEVCRLLIVVNGEGGIIFRSFNCPPGLSRRNSRRNSEVVESLAFSAIEATMDSDPDSFFNLCCDEPEVLLHVYIMPKDDYSRLDGFSVKDYGDHILTYQRWDREIKDIAAPFPEDDPTLLPKASYLYSPKRGYQGFDGFNWRSDWHRR